MKRYIPSKDKADCKRLRRIEKSRRAVERSLAHQRALAERWATGLRAEVRAREAERERQRREDRRRQASDPSLTKPTAPQAYVYVPTTGSGWFTIGSDSTAAVNCTCAWSARISS